MRSIPPNILQEIEHNFHKVIRGRVDELTQEHDIELPNLTELLAASEAKWFPVPGMYGGFCYWLEGDGENATLISESWSRIWGGSGQRHEITADRITLVDEGFV